MIKIYRAFMIAIGVVLCFGGGIMSCTVTNTLIVIEGPTKVFLAPECSFYYGVKEIAVLEKGDAVTVIDVSYPKDCKVYKIKFANGRVGFITYGDKFKVIEKQK